MAKKSKKHIAVGFWITKEQYRSLKKYKKLFGTSMSDQIRSVLFSLMALEKRRIK